MTLPSQLYTTLLYINAYVYAYCAIQIYITFETYIVTFLHIHDHDKVHYFVVISMDPGCSSDMGIKAMMRSSSRVSVTSDIRHIITATALER